MLFLGKGGGGWVVRQARQGKAGRQFVIVVGSAVAFWPGGNVIPGIIALAFSLAGPFPYVYVCVASLRRFLYHAHVVVVIHAASGQRRSRSMGGVRI